MNEPSKRQQLLDDGFCVFPGLLDGGLLARLRLASDRLLDAYPEEERRRRGNQGSVVSIRFQDRAFVELIAWPPTWAALRELGFHAARYWAGSVICQGAALHVGCTGTRTGCGGRSRKAPTRCRTSCS